MEVMAICTFRDYSGYEWMARMTKATHELGRPLLLELATPDVDISLSAKFCIGNRGVGYAHSSSDR